MGDEIKVIDPEFFFMAYANLIWALFAHMYLTQQQKESAMTLIKEQYNSLKSWIQLF
jgi:5-methylthioribose kinase